MFIFQKSRSFVFGPRGLTRGGRYKVNYRGISRYSPLDSSHDLLNSPISDISVTRGVASRRVALSPSLNLGVVDIEFLFCSMYFPSYCLATSYCYDFSPLNSHDLAKVSGTCRSVRSKARAKGLWGMPRVLPEYPTEAVRTIKMLYSSISAIFPETWLSNSTKFGYAIP